MFLVFIFLALLMLPMDAMADEGAPTLLPVADIGNVSDLTPDAKVELDHFYSLRSYRPAWNLSDEASLKRTAAFVSSVSALVAYHGLETSDYPLELMLKLTQNPTDADKQKLELLISASLIHLAHDLHGDAINLDALYTGWTFHRQPADLLALLNAAITDSSLETFFAKLAPQDQAYRALSGALQIYSAIAARGGWPRVKPGPALHLHDRDPRILQLRGRLAAEGYGPADSQNDVFDDALAKALTLYQTRNGLSPDGSLGTKTQEALDVPVSQRVTQIKANMERWRHMPEDFPPDRYTLVNIPDFSVLIIEKGKEAYRGIVIDGRPDRQTPFINSRIVNMLINPSWHVPVSLAKKDILPKLRKNPHYLEKLGFVIAGRDSDPAGVTINWKAVDPDHFPYKLRQTPGDLNSLGQLKFNFSNPFDVYMHGTPHQELFEKAERDFSSGCVRLEDPISVGEILLAHTTDKEGHWTEQRIQDEIDTGKTYFVTLAKPMPVFFLYWSVFAGDDGQINFRKDIYGYDQLLIEKLKENATPITQ